MQALNETCSTKIIATLIAADVFITLLKFLVSVV